jgi:hypothetical protein
MKQMKIPMQQTVIVKFKAIYNVKNAIKKWTDDTLQVLQFQIFAFLYISLARKGGTKVEMARN